MEHKNVGSNVASMLGGAAIGATLMYIFDPANGPERREAIADSASRAARNTGKALSATWETVREKAGDLRESAASAASTIGSRTSDIAEDIGDTRFVKRMKKQSAKLARRASRMESRVGSRLSRSASDIGEKASDFGGSIRDRFRAMLHGRRETAAEKIGLDTGPKQGLAALGLIGLGIGAMYLLDPQRGPHRRRMLREEFLSGYGRLAHTIEHQSKSAWGYLSGKSKEVTSRFAGQRPEDQIVFERVRSEIGRCVSKPSLVTVEVRRGRVNLSGPILGSEVDGLMKGLWNTPGVKEVINRLEMHESLSTFPGVQTSEDEPGSFRSQQVYTEANKI